MDLYSSLVTFFPSLQPHDFRITSTATRGYNCVAWAAGITSVWWWPVRRGQGDFWPPGLPREVTLENFMMAFEWLGYRACQSDSLEAELEKIAIYVDDVAEPTHAARQLESGWWTSKLGEGHDIEHDSLGVLEGGLYGMVAQVMSRQRGMSPPLVQAATIETLSTG